MNETQTFLKCIEVRIASIMMHKCSLLLQFIEKYVVAHPKSTVYPIKKSKKVHFLVY